MSTIEMIKTRLIDRIIAAKNEKLLVAIENIFLSTQQEEEMSSFSSEQIEMLMLSESDIEYGRLISEDELDKLDSKWMG